MVRVIPGGDNGVGARFPVGGRGAGQGVYPLLLGGIMTNTLADYSIPLVILSYLVSVLGAYTGLLMSGYIRDAAGRIHGGWLMLSAVIFGGCAIWSMHFIGMLAYSPGAPITYDAALTLISLVVPIVFTAVGLYVVYRWQGNTVAWLAAGTIMGLAVASMHYTGMAAMRIEAEMHHETTLFVLSIAIAIVAATAALWIAVNVRGALRHASALVMGLAVCGMHYTGMAAMELTPAPGEVDYFTGAVTEPVMRIAVTLSALTVSVIGAILAFNRYVNEDTSRSMV